jgi:hypothetical protein
MNIDPFVLISEKDIVSLNDMGLSCFGDEYKDILFEVDHTYIDDGEKHSCTLDNLGVERPNCTCYRFYNLRVLGQDKVIRSVMFDELILKEIKKPLDNKE